MTPISPLITAMLVIISCVIGAIIGCIVKIPKKPQSLPTNKNEMWELVSEIAEQIKFKAMEGNIVTLTCTMDDPYMVGYRLNIKNRAGLNLSWTKEYDKDLTRQLDKGVLEILIKYELQKIIKILKNKP